MAFWATRQGTSSRSTSPSPRTTPTKELAGKPVVFKIKLHDVCVRQLPALNSDFAKKMGKETMEEYRAFVNSSCSTAATAVH